MIFCTAYDEHALAAFQVQAVGYLLKPVRREQLAESLARATRVNRAQLEALLGKIHERRAQLSQQLRDIEVMQLELDEAEQRCLEFLK